MEELTGRIHSIESCGTVDGPGIRFVVFMQGCPLRCKFCHNPDTWDFSSGKVYTVSQLMEEIRKYKSYMRFSGGGVTMTGGEPLMQPDFVRKVFTLCKKEQISTALDTSGFLFSDKTKEVLEVTDLVLLDIKNFNPERYKVLTGGSLEPTLACLHYLREKKIPAWIRYVYVPGWSDHAEDISALAHFLKDYPNVERMELLPFHKMGEFKWKELGLSYELSEVEEPSKEALSLARELLEDSGILIK